MIQGVAFCYDKTIGPPHPICGTLESESIWFQDRKVKETCEMMGMSPDDIGCGVVTKANAELLLGITGVPANKRIDLDNLFYNPATNELTMAYKDE